jgi:hypothetical protein
MTRRPSTLPKIGYDGGFELAPGLVDDPNPIFRGQKQAVAVNGDRIRRDRPQPRTS